MKLPKFTGPGSTDLRRKFWDNAVAAVLASRKLAGKNISVDEYDSYGSIISINPQRQGSGSGGGVCPSEDIDVTVEISGYTSCGCVEVGPSSVIMDVTNVNGTFLLPNYDPTNWVLFDAFTVHAFTYPGVSDCSGDPVESDIDITVQFSCSDISGDMTITTQFSPFGPPFLFTAGGCPIENGNTCPYTGPACGPAGVYGEGGQAVVSWAGFSPPP